MRRIFEIRTFVAEDRWTEPTMLVLMDLETYNEALANHIEHIRDECFNEGFEAGQCPYPTEEEIIKQSVELWKNQDADMDADRTSDDS